MNRQPIVKLDVNNPAAWAMLAYAAIRGGVGGPYTDRLSGLEEWRERAGKWALVYDADAVEEEVDRLLYDSLREYPDGFFARRTLLNIETISTSRAGIGFVNNVDRFLRFLLSFAKPLDLSRSNI